MPHVSENGKGEERERKKEWEGLGHGVDCVQLHFVALPAADIGVRARVLRGVACSPSDSGKTTIFRANAKFFGQKPAAKTEEKVKKKIFYLLEEKNGIHSVQRDEVPEMRFY